MSDQEFIIAPPTVKVGFAILPIDSNINSLNLLNQVEELSGFGEWAIRTWNGMSAERRRFNSIFFSVLLKGLHLELKDQTGMEGFGEYIQWVAQQDAHEICLRVVQKLMEKDHRKDDLNIEATPEELLADKALFIDAMRQVYASHYSKKDIDFEQALFEAAHDLMQTPDEMKGQMVEHLTYMWDKHLRDEWNRNLPILEETVTAFNQLNFSGKTFLSAIEAVTGRDMSEYWDNSDTITTLMFVPSVHIGPYNAYFIEGETAYVFFGARVPEGTQSISKALSRSELLVRLNALADDTRLTILELLTQQEELCAQDIITHLNLSQSSASRHLRQLTATGYLKERRRDVAKCYTLNEERLEDTLQALTQFFRKG